MTQYKKAIVIIGRCKDCPAPCEYYESGWNIPDECKWEDIK